MQSTRITAESCAAVWFESPLDGHKGMRACALLRKETETSCNLRCPYKGTLRLALPCPDCTRYAGNNRKVSFFMNSLLMNSLRLCVPC